MSPMIPLILFDTEFPVLIILSGKERLIDQRINDEEISEQVWTQNVHSRLVQRFQKRITSKQKQSQEW